MNRQIIRLGVGLMVAYLVLFVQLNNIQVFGAEELATHPENSRPLVADFGAPRGEIRASDGTVIARSVELEEGAFARQREYPLGELFAEATGFFSFNSGSDGLERTWDDELRGDDNELSDGVRELFGGETATADIETTLSIPMQEAARTALGERRGSVVALDAQTGAVLTMWSWPTYDPNPLSSVDTAEAQAARQELLANPDNPLLPRTTRDVFFPGSTFKIVTAAAALDAGVVELDTPIFAPVIEYLPPLTTDPLQNYAAGTCGGALRDLLRQSCNAGTAQLAVELLGPDALVDTANNFGFGDVPPIGLPDVVASNFPQDYGADLGVDVELAPDLAAQLDDPAEVELTDDAPSLAQAAIGQFDVAASPLQMALVAAAVANDGEVPRPHVVNRVIDSVGATIHRPDPDVWRTAMTRETSADLRDAMVGVVTDGTARALQSEDLVVGAKTGTAQLGADNASTHAWVIAFAGDDIDRPAIAIAVIVEADEEAGEQTGGRIAAPIANDLIGAWQRSR